MGEKVRWKKLDGKIKGEKEDRNKKEEKMQKGIC